MGALELPASSKRRVVNSRSLLAPLPVSRVTCFSLAVHRQPAVASPGIRYSSPTCSPSPSTAKRSWRTTSTSRQIGPLAVGGPDGHQAAVGADASPPAPRSAWSTSLTPAYPREVERVDRGRQAGPGPAGDLAEKWDRICPPALLPRRPTPGVRPRPSEGGPFPAATVSGHRKIRAAPWKVVVVAVPAGPATLLLFPVRRLAPAPGPGRGRPSRGPPAGCRRRACWSFTQGPHTADVRGGRLGGLRLPRARTPR